ncbi:uncharacterized protein LY89DRAFT_243306 [Mollisia scopiformis]|uniref:Uncharacterized protein n=1 Tax=Mollisia scopiformis TaxID=149040 RepID=A0A194WTT5_MOLSC|nr:uncharacterized protein LY89DRAFT_243306 [Mollisia scopiformis]KUJ11365.1 hypothetical protein LY89DRAFT_243306 [Mollisia scopiformis]
MFGTCHASWYLIWRNTPSLAAHCCCRFESHIKITLTLLVFVRLRSSLKSQALPFSPNHLNFTMSKPNQHKGSFIGIKSFKFAIQPPTVWVMRKPRKISPTQRRLKVSQKEINPTSVDFFFTYAAAFKRSNGAECVYNRHISNGHKQNHLCSLNSGLQ